MNYSTIARLTLPRSGLLVFAAMVLTSCTTNRTDVPPAEPAPQPLTQSKAAEECWMETEHGAKSLPLDKRSKLVDKCVKDKMNAARTTTSTDSK